MSARDRAGWQYDAPIRRLRGCLDRDRADPDITGPGKVGGSGR